MKKVIKYLALFISLGGLIALLYSCFTVNTPPSFRYVSNCFERDKEDLILVAEHLLRSESTTFFVVDYIDENWEIALAELERVEIWDDSLLNALQGLKEKGYKYISMNDNSVEFNLWSGIRDISCGIVFAAQGTKISVSHVTEIKNIEQSGWYYYIADYNKWRTEH